MILSCQKVQYPDRSAALADIEKLKQARKWRSKGSANAGPKSGRKLRTYICPICSAWHLTTQKRRKGG